MFRETENLQFGEFTLNLPLRELQRHGTTLPVSGKAFDLLVYMASNPGRPLTKTELLEAVWPETVVEEANLSQNVFLLRKILGSGNDGPIKTLAGRGYQFAAEVLRLDPATPANLQSDENTLESAAPSTALKATQTKLVIQREEQISWHLTRGARIAAGVVSAAVLVTAGWFGWQYWLDKSGGEPVKVVLTKLGGTTGDTILDSALTDALRIDLAQSPYVTVVSGSAIRATLVQMTHKPTETLTPATAREICERTGSQAVLSGNVARVGQHFLITEEATNCVDGSVIADAKREAVTTEDLPHSIDKLAESLRQKLGESRRSIERFSTPLFAVNTVSLEALKDFSMAFQLTNQGKPAEAITLLKKAIAADPNFATAYYDLAANYVSNGDLTNGRAIIEKAYALRDTASESTRFAFTALYHSYSSLDLDEAEINDRNWTLLYPQVPQAWNLLGVVQRDLGHFKAAIESNQRTLALAPWNQGNYVNLAYSQLHVGDFQGARATCEKAIAKHLDGDRIRNIYIDVAVMLNDPALLKSQIDWGDAHPDAPFFHDEEAEVAIGEGRFKDARRLLAQTAEIFRHEGLSDFADELNRTEGVYLIEDGDVPDGMRMFHSASPDLESSTDLVGMAATGDSKSALSALRSIHEKYPQSTLWNLYYGPRIEAAAAISSHKPQDAIDILNKPRPAEARALDSHKFLGNAYLAAGQPAQAEKTFREAIAHRELDPSVSDYPQSWLGLARALAAQGKKKDSIDAYQRFLILWAHADPDAFYLLQAKKELAELQKIS
jgi:DNA-binding winged helix-turn-helix (wHTH) protein/tetratricopeptide (TPR) repeat protein